MGAFKTEIFRSEPFFLEVVPKNVDKAYSLKHLLKILGIKREEMICCGDGYNDVSMVQYAGLGVAMANGQNKLKAIANKNFLKKQGFRGTKKIAKALTYYLSL